MNAKHNDSTCLSKLVSVIGSMPYAAAPPAAIAKAKECLADFTGIFCAGTRKKDAIGLREALGGKTITNDPENTALWMGSTARMLDLDDGHRFAMGHPGVAINPAAIAMALTLPEVSGKTMLEAIIKGYEVYCYQGRVINPSAYLKRGMDATSVCGAAGAAAVAGTMMGLNAKQLGDAISLAASLTGGLNQAAIDGSAQKYLLAGWGAKLGIAAANLAKHGMGGPSGVFEGKLGYCNAFSPEPDLEYLHNPRVVWDISNTYLKQYACVRRIHATLDGVSTIVRREKLTKDMIKDVRVGGGQFVCDAGGYRPKDAAQAQTSIPYSVAIFLNFGEVSDDLMHDNIADAKIAALSDRIRVEMDDEVIRLTANDKSLWGAARVQITTTDGKVYTETKLTPDGDPENPLADGVVHAKYMGFTEPILGPEFAEQLWQQIFSLEKAPSAQAVFAPAVAKL